MSSAEDDRRNTAHGRRTSDTGDLVRENIGSGRMREVAQSDPAASPLGTDDEAGGSSNAAREIAKARREETRRG